MSNNEVPVTKEQYASVEAEIEKLKEETKRLSIEIARARDLGDLSENAEYHAAREQKGMIEGKISNLKGKLSSYQIVETAGLSDGSIQFGCLVKLHDMKFDEDIECRIVGGTTSSMNEISTSSPVGKALLGKIVGDLVSVETPKGIIKFKVLKISL